MSDFIIEEFTNYKAILYSGHQMDETEVRIEAAIYIPFSGSTAILRFIDGKLPKNNIRVHNGKEIYLSYHKAHRYSDFIDLLRNEKPLFFYYNTDNNTSYVTTSDEPVGEGPIDLSD